MRQRSAEIEDPVPSWRALVLGAVLYIVVLVVVGYLIIAAQSTPAQPIPARRARATDIEPDLVGPNVGAFTATTN